MANSRLDLLKRKNAQKTLLPRLRDQLASILVVPSERVRFLPLEMSDTIRVRAADAFPSRLVLEGAPGHRFASRRIRNAVTSRRLLPPSDASVLIVLPEADVVGVLDIPAALFNSRWGSLVAARSDGFTVVDGDLLNQLVLQLDEGEQEGDSVLDIAAWGLEWAAALETFAADAAD